MTDKLIWDCKLALRSFSNIFQQSLTVFPIILNDHRRQIASGT